MQDVIQDGVGCSIWMQDARCRMGVEGDAGCRMQDGVEGGAGCDTGMGGIECGGMGWGGIE